LPIARFDNGRFCRKDGSRAPARRTFTAMPD
jgi:hypothetical protein